MRARDPDPKYFLDNFEYSLVSGKIYWKNGTGVGSPVCHEYLYLWNGERYTYQHRVAWLLVTGQWPSADIDHKNQKRNQNQWCNIREATRQQNCHNRAQPNVTNKAGIKGLRYRKHDGFWEPRLTVNYKAIYLGIFKDLDEAIAVRKAAELEFA